MIRIEKKVQPDKYNATISRPLQPVPRPAFFGCPRAPGRAGNDQLRISLLGFGLRAGDVVFNPNGSAEYILVCHLETISSLRSLTPRFLEVPTHWPQNAFNQQQQLQ